jgi:hypothetical protein
MAVAQIAEVAGGPRAVHVELRRGPVPLPRRHVLALFLRHSRWDDSSAVPARRLLAARMSDANRAFRCFC